MQRILKAVSLTALGISIFLLHYTVLCQWKWSDSEARFLLLADPQMEGDAKIRRLGKQGEVDLVMNEYYFRHIYRSFVSPYALLFRSRPTHVALLGDVFSCQWIRDDEFDRRVNRFKWIYGGDYSHRMYNVSGNHDIGYSGDITHHLLNRWKRAFGELNFHDRIRSRNDGSSEKVEHQLTVINSQNIDGPARDESLRAQTWEFLNSFADQRAKENYRTPLILLMHIPTHKRKGICPDAPFVRYYNDGTLREQTHLSTSASAFILAKLRPRYIFVGHDHRGCDVTHVVRIANGQDTEPHIETFKTSAFEMQKAERTSGSPAQAVNTSDELPRAGDDAAHNETTLVIREVTVTSMMAEFGGNAGLFEIRRRPQKVQHAAASNNSEDELFEYHYSSCPFATHYVITTILIVDAILLFCWICVWLFSFVRVIVSKLRKMFRDGVPAPFQGDIISDMKANGTLKGSKKIITK